MTVEMLPSNHESPLSLMGKIIAIFLIVGAGLGAATLIFLSATGFFEPTESEGLEAIGEQFIGGIAIATVLVFALLMGVVLAALGGLHAGNKSPDRLSATVVGAIAGFVGHVALVAALGSVLVFGIDLLESNAEEAAPTPTPIQTQSPQDRAACEELFGAGSDACADPTLEEDETTTDEGGSVSFEDIWRIGLGLIPAAVVGGLSGAIVFARRTVGPEPAGRVITRRQ